MSSAKLIAEALFTELLEERADRYGALLSEGSPGSKIKVYRDAMRVFSTLDVDQQRAMVQFFKLILADAVSAVLGTFDGSTGLLQNEFVVTYAGDEVQGELFDAFGEIVEMSGLLAE